MSMTTMELNLVEQALQNPNSGVILDDWVESVEAELDSKRNTLEFLAKKLQIQASRLAKLDPNLDVVGLLKGPTQMLTRCYTRPATRMVSSQRAVFKTSSL